MKELYCVYTKKIAFLLRKKGFRIVKTDVNYKRPEFDVYYFKDTPELHTALVEIAKEYKK